MVVNSLRATRFSYSNQHEAASIPRGSMGFISSADWVSTTRYSLSERCLVVLIAINVSFTPRTEKIGCGLTTGYDCII